MKISTCFLKGLVVIGLLVLIYGGVCAVAYAFGIGLPFYAFQKTPPHIYITPNSLADPNGTSFGVVAGNMIGALFLLVFVLAGCIFFLHIMRMDLTPEKPEKEDVEENKDNFEFLLKDTHRKLDEMRR